MPSIGDLLGTKALYAPMFNQAAPDATPFADALKVALDSQAAALAAQTAATKAADVASLPQIDSESARAASDARRKKLTAGSNFGIGMPSLLGAPPVGYRMLAGE